jgi:hypothetical protein
MRKELETHESVYIVTKTVSHALMELDSLSLDLVAGGDVGEMVDAIKEKDVGSAI